MNDGTVQGGILPPQRWDKILPEKLRLSVATIDQFGLPLEQRGLLTDVPRPDDVQRFATEAGEIVRKTVLFMFGQPEDEGGTK